MNTKKLRQKILDLAIRGKLVSQDPNDEPASTLLERIRTKKNYFDFNEMPFDLPDNWSWVNLGDICEMATGPFGTMISKRDHQATGVPVLGIENIGYGKFIYGNKIFVSTEKAEELKAFSLIHGDVIISRSGTVGELCLVPEDMVNSILSTNLIRVRINKKSMLSTLFVHLFYSEKIMLDQVRELCKGSTRVFLNQKILKSLIIPLPPLTEQRRIVKSIESAFAIIDEIERNKTDLQAAVTAAKSKILSLAIRGKLVPQDSNDEPAAVLLERIGTEKERLKKAGQIKKEKSLPAITENEIAFDIPERWSWCRLGHISSNVQYGLSNSAESSGNCRLLRITDIQDNNVEWNSVPHTTITDEQIKEYELEIGDIVFARTGATVGKSFLIMSLPVHSVFASYLIRVKIMQASPEYVKYFFDSTSYWEQITDKSVGIGQPNVNGTKLKELTLPLPPLAEQYRIVAAIDAAFEQLDKVMEVLI